VFQVIVLPAIVTPSRTRESVAMRLFVSPGETLRGEGEIVKEVAIFATTGPLPSSLVLSMPSLAEK
jgi:hypothetical protein